MPFVSIPDNPPPLEGTEWVLKAKDGVRLRAGVWKPNSVQRRGTICLLQGRAEFIEKYFETVGDLTARGFTVAALDWRGQGGSERPLRDPRKGHVRHFKEYLRDLDIFTAEVRTNCPPPYYAVAHSMGGLILLHAIKRDPNLVSRAVFSSPVFEVGTLFGNPDVLAPIAAVATFFGFGRAYVPGQGGTPVNWYPFAGNPVTSDGVRYARAAAVVEADPSLALGGPTIAWTKAMFDAQFAINADGFAERIGLPMLLLSSGLDRIVQNRAIQRIGRRLRMGRVITIDGANHELFAECDVYREPVLAAIDAFLTGSP